MTEHAWAEEHVTAYAAGGLSAQEAERLEAHTRGCPECAVALADARSLDRGLTDLFAGVRPGPELEDRAVTRLRASSERKASTPLRKLLTAAAAVLLLGVCGALLTPGLLGTNPNETFSFVGSSVRLDSTAAADRSAAQAEREASYTSANGAAHQAQLDALLNGADAARRRGSAHASAVTRDNLGQPNAPAVDPVIAYSSDGSRVPVQKSQTSMEVAKNEFFDPTKVKPSVFASQPDPTYTAQKPEPAPQPKSPPDKVPPPAVDPPPTPEPVRRIVIRSGDIEFEVPSFDAASAAVTKLVTGIKGAFVATVNSDKLPNGKVKGSITVRCPPEALDGLVLDLRKELGATGELKGVRLTSQDVTKQYTDTESRLRGARTMEQRLLQIIKEGKGEIKQLLEAERELGVWRTRIEEYEGELRYFANLAALSTLTITLAEREIRAAAGLTESERVQTGVEVEDVDGAYQQLLKAITDAKGRILKSEVKQLSAGQFNASLHFEVAPEASGPLRDRLRQLGRVARLEIDRLTQAVGGTLPTDAKTTRGDTVFLVQLYNLANVAPRETATVQVAAVDVPAAYQALRDAVAKTAGRVLAAQLNEQDRTNVSAQFDFEVRRADEGAVRAAVEAAGEVISRQVTRAAEGDSVTDAKVLYKATLVAANRLRPRQTTTLSVEVPDVDGAAAVFAAQVAEAKGRQVDAQSSRDRSGKATAKLAFEVPLAAAAGLVERFKAAGVVRANTSTRDPQATEGRFATARVDVSLTGPDEIVAEGEGLWPQVRRGLTYSAAVLLKSVTWVVFGLCVVLPWAVVVYAGYWVVSRLFRPAPAPVAAAPAPPLTPAPPAG